MFNLLCTIGVIALCGYLWWVGGHGTHQVRLLVFPFVIALTKLYLLHWSWWAVAYFPTLIILLASINYGEQSLLHKLWVWLFKGKGSDGEYLPVELCVRSTCGLFWSLAGIWFVVAGGSWIHQIIYTVFAMIAVPIFGVLINNDIWSEGGSGASVSCSLLI